RKHKYLLGEKYTSSMSRHIPHEVKIEVWTRDGGRCVGCGASDYLEFDHIIPHSHGGASTVNNVQLLCRRCNLEKSDRI
ncbi:MAG: HNH endonuclease, partial [Planctomycetaceae bacterium]|nr:HNH endonuclease [Planctomycetaceae bacterium]